MGSESRLWVQFIDGELGCVGACCFNWDQPFLSISVNKRAIKSGIQWCRWFISRNPQVSFLQAVELDQARNDRCVQTEWRTTEICDGEWINGERKISLVHNISPTLWLWIRQLNKCHAKKLCYLPYYCCLLSCHIIPFIDFLWRYERCEWKWIYKGGCQSERFTRSRYRQWKQASYYYNWWPWQNHC